MYEPFYGLDRPPFPTFADPAEIFWSESHADAFAMLRYGVLSQAPVTVLSGEAGAGKTTLLRRLAAENTGRTVGFLSAPGDGPLIDWVLMAFGQPHGDGAIRGFERLRGFLGQLDGPAAVLIIDEAQGLDEQRLEELRRIGTIAPEGTGLSLVLAGQPQLRERIEGAELRHFAQRVAADCRLGPLGASETRDYLGWKLGRAGARRQIVTPAASMLIHQVAGGLPRLINILADLALMRGFGIEASTVEAEDLHQLLVEARERGLYPQLASVRLSDEAVRDLGKRPVALESAG